MSCRPRIRQSGFTLIEAIVVMVITGILAAIVAVFITKPVEGYADAVRRAELTDVADVALRRMSREVRMALPNSLRVSGNCVEFIMTSAGGRYREVGDGSTGGLALNWTSTVDCTTTPNNCKFDVLGTMPSNPAIAANDYVVIYNLGAGYNPANAYNFDSATDTCRVGGCNVAKVSSVAAPAVTLAANPFALQSPPLPSPDARFQVIPGGTKAISYECAGGQLKRFSNYALTTAQTCPPTGTGATLAGDATTTASCTLDYSSAASGRSSLLFVQLNLTSGGETVSLFQQIRVDNAP
jgi:MSHA biogenesis protein MshO